MRKIIVMLIMFLSQGLVTAQDTPEALWVRVGNVTPYSVSCIPDGTRYSWTIASAESISRTYKVLNSEPPCSNIMKYWKLPIGEYRKVWSTLYFSWGDGSYKLPCLGKDPQGNYFDCESDLSIEVIVYRSDPSIFCVYIRSGGDGQFFYGEKTVETIYNQYGEIIDYGPINGTVWNILQPPESLLCSCPSIRGWIAGQGGTVDVFAAKVDKTAPYNFTTLSQYPNVYDLKYFCDLWLVDTNE